MHILKFKRLPQIQTHNHLAHKWTLNHLANVERYVRKSERYVKKFSEKSWNEPILSKLCEEPLHS